MYMSFYRRCTLWHMVFIIFVLTTALRILKNDRLLCTFRIIVSQNLSSHTQFLLNLKEGSDD